MSQTPDPTDAKADGNFGSAGSHRTGYANDKLANAEYWARKGGTLNAGEGAILCEEIDRLRSILSALREPSGKVIRRMTQRTIEGLHHVDLDIVLDAIRVALPAAVEAAEQEVGS